MKKKVFIYCFILTLLLGSFTVFAKEKDKDAPIFMGEVQEVLKNDTHNEIRLRVKGYIKSCKVYEEELIAIVSEGTTILPKECNKTNTKICLKDLQVEKGDSVYIELSNAMTKSIPPQSAAKAIQITRPTE